MPSRRSMREKRWFIYPLLHDRVSSLLEEDGLRFSFHGNDDPNGFIKEEDKTIMGRFMCHNRACVSSGWSSKKVAITIRMYSGEKYNARVYNQRCKRCEKLGRLHIDEETYVERVSYRIKKWCGIQQQQPYYSGGSKGPHNSDLCEGCKAGHCSAKTDELAMQMQKLGF